MEAGGDGARAALTCATDRFTPRARGGWQDVLHWDEQTSKWRRQHVGWYRRRQWAYAMTFHACRRDAKMWRDHIRAWRLWRRGATKRAPSFRRRSCARKAERWSRRARAVWRAVPAWWRAAHPTWKASQLRRFARKR